jgi:hypothetical protein
MHKNMESTHQNVCFLQTMKVIPSETQGLEATPLQPQVVKPIGSAEWSFPIG